MVQLFFASLGVMRSGIGCVHSNCAPLSKKRHCLQLCNSKLHLGHWPLGSKPLVSTAPQLEQRARAKLIGARAALRRLAVVRPVLLILLFRVAITAVTILSIHKRLRTPKCARQFARKSRASGARTG